MIRDRIFVSVVKIIVFLQILLTFHIEASVIMGVGGVEPRMTFRFLSKADVDIIFYHFKDRWIDDLKRYKSSGRLTIVLMMGPESLKGSYLLSHEDIYPNYLILLNPGCVKLPDYLKIVFYPDLFNFSFPILGEWWLEKFFDFSFRGRNVDRVILLSYIHYWRENKREIPDFFRCRVTRFKYKGKTIMIRDPELRFLKKCKYSNYFSNLRIFDVPNAGFFIQESNPWYILAIINSVLRRRLR